MAFKSQFPFRALQIFFSLAVLVFSILVVYWENQHLSTLIIFLIFVPCFALLMSWYIGLASYFMLSPPCITLFAIEFVISLLYVASSITVIILAITSSGNLCVAGGANGAFSIFSYLAWGASATIHAIELSKIRKESSCIEDMSKKLIEVV